MPGKSLPYYIRNASHVGFCLRFRRGLHQSCRRHRFIITRLAGFSGPFADVFVGDLHQSRRRNRLWTMYLAHYRLDPWWFHTVPGLTLKAGLRMTTASIDLIQDVDMHLFVDAEACDEPGYRFSIIRLANYSILFVRLLKPFFWNCRHSFRQIVRRWSSRSRKESQGKPTKNFRNVTYSNFHKFKNIRL